MNFCSSCGARLESGSQFCGSCGARVTASSSPAAASVDSEAPTYATNMPDESAHASSSPGSPWAGSSAHPGGQSFGFGSNHPGSTIASANPAVATSGSNFLTRIPRGVYLGVAAVAAVGLGVAGAFALRGTPEAKMPRDLSQQNQTAGALTGSPGKKWHYSATELAQHAGIDTSSSTASSSLLDDGKNGIVVASVTADSKSAIVGITEATGKVAWHVDGDFSNCVSTENKAGWVCVMTPNSSPDDSQTPATKLVTLDANGHATPQQDFSDQDNLGSANDGSLWVTRGLQDGTTGDSTSDSSGSQDVSVQKIDPDGKPGWKFERNLNVASDSLSTYGSAGLALFVVDGTTYLRGVQTSDGKGVALDDSGKPTDKAKNPVLGNDRGRPITADKGRYRDGSKTMKSDTASLASALITDSAKVPLFNISGSELQKLNADGTGVDWKNSADGAIPTAFCGGTTLAEKDGSDLAWMFDSSGHETWSGSTTGNAQFCWGGTQFTWLDGTTLTAFTVKDHQQTWSVNLAADSDNNSGEMNVAPSPTHDGLVAADEGTVTYWGN